MLNRRSFLGASALAAGAGLADSSIFSAAWAKAPLAAAQAPGFYRFKAGGLEITALNDGAVTLPTTIFTAPSLDEVDGVLGKSGRPPKEVTVSVNAFAVNTGDALILVDSGSGNAFGPAGGALIKNLGASGYTPQQVDAVVITHLHGDHAAGLLTPDGKAAYPNATVLINEAELAFWSDEGNTSRAPEFVRPSFALTKAIRAAYQGKLDTYKNNDTVQKALIAVPTPGHTPGHTSLRVGTGKDAVLLWGDVLHASAVQFAKPEYGFAFDSDQELAKATRKRVLDMASADNLMIAGVHLGFPGIGNVTRDGGAYAFHPAFWTPTL
jgi:glyoxylase-like metal-dependent hydrolase (beta-lactamase superfamily II)